MAPLVGTVRMAHRMRFAADVLRAVTLISRKAPPVSRVSADLSSCAGIARIPPALPGCWGDGSNRTVWPSPSGHLRLAAVPAPPVLGPGRARLVNFAAEICRQNRVHLLPAPRREAYPKKRLGLHGRAKTRAI